MSNHTAGQSPAPSKKSAPSKTCGIEAENLLNCVTQKNYDKEKCVALIDKLRACVRKNRVAKFDLVDESLVPK